MDDDGSLFFQSRQTFQLQFILTILQVKGYVVVLCMQLKLASLQLSNDAEEIWDPTA